MRSVQLLLALSILFYAAGLLLNACSDRHTVLSHDVVVDNPDGTLVATAPSGKVVALDAPTNLRIEILNASSVRFEWDGVTGATDYDVNYKSRGGKWTNSPHGGTATEHVLDGLDAGVEYRWAVKADRGREKSAWSYAPWFAMELDRSGYNIDLVFLDQFSDAKLTARQKELVRMAAARWEEVIVGDVEDVFHDGTKGWETHTFWTRRRGEEAYVDTIRITGHIDDVRIYVRVEDNLSGGTAIATGSDLTYRISWNDDGTWSSGFTSSGLVKFNSDYLDLSDSSFFTTGLHEIGHVVGISHRGLLSSGYYRPLVTTGLSTNTDKTHFIGPSAIKYFKLMGGRGNKIPLLGFSHWHPDVLGNDIMNAYPTDDAGISLVTVGALSDMGYEVDFGAADDVELYGGAGKAIVGHIH